jgi:prophage maintenance system killer protein
MWKKNEIVELNKSVGGRGKLINEGNLDFAVSAQQRTKDWLSQLAYVVRALLVGHAFEDYNKRTSVAVMVTTFEGLKLAYDPYAVDNLVTRIAKKRIGNVKTIRSMIRDVIR